MQKACRPSSAVQRLTQVPQALSRPKARVDLAVVARQVVLGQQVDLERRARDRGQLGLGHLPRVATQVGEVPTEAPRHVFVRHPLVGRRHVPVEVVLDGRFELREQLGGFEGGHAPSLHPHGAPANRGYAGAPGFRARPGWAAGYPAWCNCAVGVADPDGWAELPQVASRAPRPAPRPRSVIAPLAPRPRCERDAGRVVHRDGTALRGRCDRVARHRLIRAQVGGRHRHGHATAAVTLPESVVSYAYSRGARSVDGLAQFQTDWTGGIPGQRERNHRTDDRAPDRQPDRAAGQPPADLKDTVASPRVARAYVYRNDLIFHDAAGKTIAMIVVCSPKVMSPAQDITVDTVSTWPRPRRRRRPSPRRTRRRRRSSRHHTGPNNHGTAARRRAARGRGRCCSAEPAREPADQGRRRPPRAGRAARLSQTSETSGCGRGGGHRVQCAQRTRCGSQRGDGRCAVG